MSGPGQAAIRPARAYRRGPRPSARAACTSPASTPRKPSLRQPGEGRQRIDQRRDERRRAAEPEHHRHRDQVDASSRDGLHQGRKRASAPGRAAAGAPRCRAAEPSSVTSSTATTTSASECHRLGPDAEGRRGDQRGWIAIPSAKPRLRCANQAARSDQPGRDRNRNVQESRL